MKKRLPVLRQKPTQVKSFYFYVPFSHWWVNTSKNATLRIHWRLLTILKISNKCLKSCFLICKTIYILNRLCIEIKHKRLKNLPWTKWTLQKMHSFAFNSRFLFALKHKVHLSKTVCGVLHFQFRLVLIKVYIFVQ